MTSQSATLDNGGGGSNAKPGKLKRLGNWIRSKLTLRTVAGFLLHGGSSLVNFAAGYWLIKYLWAWKAFSFMPDIGTGPTAEGGSTKWVLYAVLFVISACVANLAFADFRNRPTAWTHIVSGGFLFAVAAVALLDYYVRKSTAITLTDVQEHVMHAFAWTGILSCGTGLVALRLNRLYFGDIAGGGVNR